MKGRNGARENVHHRYDCASLQYGSGNLAAIA